MTSDGLRVDFERQQGLFCKKDGADRFLSSFDFGLAGPGPWVADWTAQSADESEERDAGRAAVTGRPAGGKSVRVLGCGRACPLGNWGADAWAGTQRKGAPRRWSAGPGRVGGRAVTGQWGRVV